MNISSYITRAGEGKATRTASLFKVLASPARVRMLRALFHAREKDNELCVYEIASAAGLSQSATSHQLTLLEARGIVFGERMGQTTCYHLADSSTTRDIEAVFRTLNV